MESVIDVEHLCHRYGRYTVYENVNFSIPPGKIYGLLGKNGVGKTTLIKILMGFLRPVSGRCRVFGEDSHALNTNTRARIGLLFEGHVAYEFMSICNIERFYASFYPGWKPDIYYRKVERLGLQKDHLLKNLSCGQRSQVVLGLLMAQQPDLLLLDDYSIGLDAGYRRLFLDEMQEFLTQGDRTVFLTSHVIQDMERLVDEVIFLERGGRLLSICLDDFRQRFACYRLEKGMDSGQTSLSKEILSACPGVKNIEVHASYWDLFTFSPKEELLHVLNSLGQPVRDMVSVPLSLEDAFIGYTGRY